MKLYYSPGTCSLSPHIVLSELGLTFTPVKVDLKTKQTADGGDYLKINSKGSVPALQLESGEVLTEGAAIVQYLADQKPDAGLAPRWGSFERYRLLEMLNFIASEVHKGFSPLFHPGLAPEARETALANLRRRFDWLSGVLAHQPFLLGDSFSVADAYLFTVIGWTRPLKIDLAEWPLLKDYYERIRRRPHVGQAMRAEGLVK